jgi:hypothetical protein
MFKRLVAYGAILVLSLSLTACASGKVDARKLAIGGLAAQQATDQAVRSTKSLYDQKVIGLPEAEKVTLVRRPRLGTRPCWPSSPSWCCQPPRRG